MVPTLGGSSEEGNTESGTRSREDRLKKEENEEVGMSAHMGRRQGNGDKLASQGPSEMSSRRGIDTSASEHTWARVSSRLTLKDWRDEVDVT